MDIEIREENEAAENGNEGGITQRVNH